MIKETLILSYLFVTRILYAEKLIYISVEHPNVTHTNPKYCKWATLTSKRYGRSNPVYYVGLDFEVLIPMDRNVLLDFYFYELLSNMYKPTFVEMHFNFCYLIEKDKFFGSALRQGKFNKPCPHPAGEYHLSNMTINPKFIPRGFPFTKGRIYCNLTYAETKENIAGGYIDMEVKTINVKKTKNVTFSQK